MGEPISKPGRDGYYADDENFRMAHRGNADEMFTAQRRTMHRSWVLVGMTNPDAPDLSMLLADEQARGLRDWLIRQYPTESDQKEKP